MEEGGNSALFNMVADIQDSFYQNDVLLGIEVTVEGSKPFHLPCYRQPQLRNKQAAWVPFPSIYCPKTALNGGYAGQRWLSQGLWFTPFLAWYVSLYCCLIQASFYTNKPVGFFAASYRHKKARWPAKGYRAFLCFKMFMLSGQRAYALLLQMSSIFRRGYMPMLAFRRECPCKFSLLLPCRVLPVCIKR